MQLSTLVRHCERREGTGACWPRPGDMEKRREVTHGTPAIVTAEKIVENSVSTPSTALYDFPPMKCHRSAVGAQVQDVCVSGCGPWWDARAERSAHGQRCRHPPVSPQFCCSFGSFFTIANSKILFLPWCLQRRQGWHARTLGVGPRSGAISTTETLTQLVFRNLSLRPRVRPMRHSEQHAARSDAGVGSRVA